MEGKVIRITRVPNGIMILIWFGGKEYGRTYTGENFRNYALWSDLKVGDQVDGLVWKDMEKGIVDADSPVHVL